MRDALAGRSYVDEYVQTLAHELKSPLAAIRGAAELLGEPMPEDARARFAGNINEQVRRAQSLIDRMLELSSLERRGALDRVERIAVGPLLAQVRDEQAPVAQRRGVRIEVRDLQNEAVAPGGVAQVDPALQLSGDPFLVQRALGNLVKNAVEFAPTGSAVTIAVDARPHDVRLSVRDHGPGLPEFARERVFQKFFSLPRPDTGRKGTGLGLAFVREVAALHGGRATLDNHPDGGAIAMLALPRASARSAPLPDGLT
jgi:two-component system sensor histidine kinase CreC